jgi:NosR/NirI family nitrous oxide reductase transcriptional regulator
MAGCKNWGRAIIGMIGPVLLCLMALAGTAQSDPIVEKFIPKVPIDELVPGADAYGPMHADLPVLPAQKDGKTIGYVFLTSDFVTTTGYSGKPIHVLMGVDNDAKVTGVNLVKHSEPIVLIGIPNSKIKAVTESYKGMDLTEEAASGGSAHELDIVSGATVTIMVIDDSIVRAGIKVARQLGLGGLQPTVRNSGPQKTIKRPEGAEAPVSDWQTLDGDGSIRTLRLDVGQVNQAFIDSGDARAIARPDKGAPEDTFIEMHVALASVPEIGRTLLGDDEYANLQDWLEEGEEAILVLGRGKYSFKGSGYVRGGIFDRIQLIQQDNSARFFDKQQRRLGRLAPDDAPSFTELDIFKIPADIEFDPAEPFRLQLLVQRAVGAIDKTFITFDLGYRLPDRYLEVVTPAAAPTDTTSAAATSDPDELSKSRSKWHCW